MAGPRFRRWWDSLMSLGAYSGETDSHRGTRRIVVGYFVFGALVRLPISASEFGDGKPWPAVLDLTAALTGVLLLLALALKPDRFPWIVHAALFLILVEVLAGTIMFGGLLAWELVIRFGFLGVIGALIVLSIKAALLWWLADGVTIVLAVVLPERIEPLYVVEGTPAGIASTIVGVTMFLFASRAYFVRQRDRSRRNPTTCCTPSCRTRSPGGSSRTER